MTPVALPELPEPKLRFEVAISKTGQRLDYSAEDMRAFALAERAAERERLIVFVQNFTPKGYVEHHGDFMDELLAAIRNQP